MTDRPLTGRLTAATEPWLTTAARRIVLSGGRRLAIGSLDVLEPDGVRHRLGTPGATPHAEIHVHEDGRPLPRVGSHAELDSAVAGGANARTAARRRGTSPRRCGCKASTASTSCAL